MENLLLGLEPSVREFYYGNASKPAASEDNTEAVVEFLYDICKAGPLRDEMERKAAEDGEEGPKLIGEQESRKVIEMERRMQVAFRSYKNYFPLSIWACCKRCCFSLLACDQEQFMVFDEAMRIHEVAQSLHRRIGDISKFVEARRRGVGLSNMAFVPLVRSERQFDLSTDRQKAVRQLGKFVADVLPFLYGVSDSRSGVRRPKKKLCAQSICCLLGVSRNFLYKRTSLRTPAHTQPSDEELYTSILDTAGVRMRQYRRLGLRTGFPEVDKLCSFHCGCSEPCFAEAPLLRLYEWYDKFRSLSQQLKPRRKENQFLLNVMLCPLLNCTVRLCNKALSALFTVSESTIADVRRVLDMICKDPSLDSRALLKDKEKGYRYSGRHPMNRYSPAVRERIEIYLDMLLRADPGASDGVNVCRVYSPEINTQEKLRQVLAKQLEDDEIVDEPISSGTLQRMIKEYLTSKQCEISFTQSDHNACPTCKTLQYALLQFCYERKLLESRRNIFEGFPRPMTKTQQEDITVITSQLRAKNYQESTALQNLRGHNLRDANIRKFLKELTDHFRTVENAYVEMEGEAAVDWCTRHDHAVITHQDDMTKVDLPSFIINASSDITRWRYDVNAHVSAVTGECIVFSHEQGGGAKTGSSIMEVILLDHILRCRGEGIKVIVSDNASVGKNWLTTVAMPQYFVDQGLAEIVIVLFLENNHGKWLADMLFGQLQIRRQRSTILGIDALLSEFEAINRKRGSIEGFAINPLSCIDFATVLSSLGYGTKPSKDFGFVKRNIHFAAACVPGAKSRLPISTQKILGDLLPEDDGMVRICSEPPQHRPQKELPFEKRYFDIPAVALPNLNRSNAAGSCHISRNPADTDNDGCHFLVEDALTDPPLIVEVNKEYAASGPGVVSNRNMTHVGFNGLAFRKLNACPELRNPDDPIVREAWPAGLLKPFGNDDAGEPLYGSEAVKCAPENWVLRRPVSHFAIEGNIVSRYPPRNMLNAKFKKGPRNESPWNPVQTYSEPPFPLVFRSGRRECSASASLRDFSTEHTAIAKTVNVLDLLRCVYRRMGDRQSVSDQWLQKRVTRPSTVAIAKYRSQLQLFNDREHGHPKSARTVRQVFKDDATIKAEVFRIRQQPGETRSAAKVTASLFDEASSKPGGLDRFEHMVERDLERYAAELKTFIEVTQRKFDEDHGLLPVTEDILIDGR